MNITLDNYINKKEISITIIKVYANATKSSNKL